MLCEKIRRFVKHMNFREQELSKLHKFCKQLELAELDLILDNSSKWDATPQMLDRIVQLEKAIAAYIMEAGQQLPQDVVLVQKDFDFARELGGVLRPITNATHLLEGDTSRAQWCCRCCGFWTRNSGTASLSAWPVVRRQASLLKSNRMDSVQLPSSSARCFGRSCPLSCSTCNRAVRRCCWRQRWTRVGKSCTSLPLKRWHQ